VSELQLSPVASIYNALRALNASWSVDIGQPSGSGWIAGAELRDAATGPFNALLLRIGERQQSADKMTIAASFALRYGWASAMAIAPYLRYGCVPDISLENISLKFKESTFFERTAIHEARGMMAVNDPVAEHPTITTVATQRELLRALRSALTDQALPVVDALYQWSGFSRRGTWGMLTSSWAAHVTSLHGDKRDQRGALPILREFFAGDDLVAIMQPRVHEVTYMDVTHIYQRRASCCRIYLLPQKELCASCPLVSQEERLERNRAWMKTQIERENTPLAGHT
jgi:FhuF 2Fe-2S C-terminal domain/Ferric iron reductase FhuF-like transporter